MFVLLKITFLSQIKWKLWMFILFYLIFCTNIVLSLRFNFENDCLNWNPNVLGNFIPQKSRKIMCFLIKNASERDEIFHKNFYPKEYDPGPKIGSKNFYLNVYNYTHNRNILNRPDPWSSYYNRNKINTKWNNQYSRPNISHYSRRNIPMNTFFPVQNPYGQINTYPGTWGTGMTFYGQQFVPVPVIQNPYQPRFFQPQPFKEQFQPITPQKNLETSEKIFKKMYFPPSREQRKIYKFSSFDIYTDITWLEDDNEGWPGTEKVKLGQVYSGILRYFFTPYDALVLLSDIKVEGSLSMSHLPEMYSKNTLKDLFKIDHLMKFKLKEPLEFDQKGRPRFVPILNIDKKPNDYRYRERVRGKPIFLTNTMGIFKLEDNFNYAQLFIVNTGIYMSYPLEHKMADLFSKGELVEMEVLHGPHGPSATGYLCRITPESDKGKELKSRFTMVYDLVGKGSEGPTDSDPPPSRNNQVVSYSSTPFGSYLDSNYFSRRAFLVDQQFNSKFLDSTPFVDQNEYLLPLEKEKWTLKEFAKRIGCDVKVLLGFISLKTKTIVSPSSLITRTMAKILVNFVKSKNVFEIIETIQQAEFDDFQKNNHSVMSDRNPVVTLLGGPGDGKSSLFEVLCGVKSDPESNFNFGKVKSEYSITMFDTPSNDHLRPLVENILRASDLAVILISGDVGVTKYTKECVDLCNRLNIPFVFVLSKFDVSSQENMENIMAELSDMGLVVEQLGGQIQMIVFSNKEDLETNTKNLTEALVLQASVSDEMKSTTTESVKADGYVLDSGKSKHLGFYSFVLVKNGEIGKTDHICTNANTTKVKSIKNSKGNSVNSLKTSEAGYVYGFDKDSIPDPGTTFRVYDSNDDSSKMSDINKIHETGDQLSEQIKERISESLDEIGEVELDNKVKEIPVVLRCDVKAMVDVIKTAIENLKCEGFKNICKYKVIDQNIGNFTKDDLEGAKNAKIVVVYNSPLSSTVQKKLNSMGIKLIKENSIDEIVNKAEEELEVLLGEKKLGRLVGKADILKVFEASKKRNAAGCVVTYGNIMPFYDVRILRGDKILFYGKISSLRRTSEEASEISETESCGITFQDFNDFQVGDVVEAYID